MWWAALKRNSHPNLGLITDLMLHFTQKEDVNRCKCRVKTQKWCLILLLQSTLIAAVVCSYINLTWSRWCYLWRGTAFSNEWGFFCTFYSMSTSDQPALIEPNKLNLRGSDASPSLSVWISLSLIRFGSRPVPVVSVEVEKVGTVYGEANLTNLTASLSAPTTADGWMLCGMTSLARSP